MFHFDVHSSSFQHLKIDYGTIHDFPIHYLNPENVMFDDLDQVHIIHYVSGDEKVQTQTAYIQTEIHENPNVAHYGRDI